MCIKDAVLSAKDVSVCPSSSKTYEALPHSKRIDFSMPVMGQKKKE